MRARGFPSCDNPLMHLRLLLSVSITAALLSVACGISTPSSNKVETVSGIIPVGGSDSKNFSNTKTGELQITVTTLSPSPSASLGLAIGQQITGTCSLIQNYVASLVVNRVVEFGSLQKGDYCLYVYDTGVLTAATAYTAKISHP